MKSLDALQEHLELMTKIKLELEKSSLEGLADDRSGDDQVLSISISELDGDLRKVEKSLDELSIHFNNLEARIDELEYKLNPKKKVTKTLEKWVNIYSDNIQFWYDSEQEANDASKNAVNKIACVNLTGTYEE